MREDLKLRFPPQAVEEYEISREGKLYLFTGAKATGGFCVTRKGLLLPSKLGPILRDTPGLLDCRAPERAFIAYKGRKYCWLGISRDGTIQPTETMLSV